jgi:tetratricopeptide (TPR) repeat protein
MSFRLKSLALAGFATLLLSLPAFSQTTAVEGIVKGPDGKPLVGATVQFNRTDIKGVYNVKTDKKGHYGHYGLPIGVYEVSVVVDGQTKDKYAGIRTHLGEALPVNFDLKDQQPGAPGAAGLAQPEQKGLSAAEKDKQDKETKAREAQIAKNKELNDSFQAGRAAMDAANAATDAAAKAAKYDEAIAAFAKASTIDDKQVVIWSNLAEAYMDVEGMKPAEADAYCTKAFDAYKKSVELKPDDAAYYNNYALSLAKCKKMDDAKTNLDKAAQLDPPGAGKYYYNMGALLVNGGQSDAACESFKRAIDSDATYADAQYQYGVCLAAKASTDASGKVIAQPGTIEALQKYLNLKPDGPMAASAKELIATLGGTVSTTFVNPAAKTPAPAPKKK